MLRALETRRPHGLFSWHSLTESANHALKSWLLRRNPVNFRPLQDRVLVRRIEQEEKTKGGIIIPDTAKEKPMEGEVDRRRARRPGR